MKKLDENDYVTGQEFAIEENTSYATPKTIKQSGNEIKQEKKYHRFCKNAAIVVPIVLGIVLLLSLLCVCVALS